MLKFRIQNSSFPQTALLLSDFLAKIKHTVNVLIISQIYKYSIHTTYYSQHKRVHFIMRNGLYHHLIKAILRHEMGYSERQ